jgi:hypothetical protein
MSDPEVEIEIEIMCSSPIKNGDDEESSRH